MRRPQVKPCQGRYNITARVKAGSHHTTSRAWQHRETLQGRVFISGDRPSHDQAAAPAVSSRQPKEDGRRAPPELTDSRSFSLPSARCRWEQAPGGAGGLGTAASALHQTSSSPPVSRRAGIASSRSTVKGRGDPPAQVPTAVATQLIESGRILLPLLLPWALTQPQGSARREQPRQLPSM